MRGLTLLVLSGLLATTLLASTATALPVPNPTRCKVMTDVQCLVNQVCNPASGEACAQPGLPYLPVKCDPANAATCVPVSCYTLSQLPVRAKGGCIDVACVPAYTVLGSCSASEVLCQDVTPLYQRVAVPVAGNAGGQLLGLLGGTPAVGPATIFRNVLVRAAFYCEPPTGGPGSIGQGCQEVVTTGPVRIGNRDTLLHDLNLGATPLTKGNDCAWLRSTATGYLYAATDGEGWQVVDLANAQSDCQLKVRVGVQEFGLGLGQHAESFRFVYC